MSVGRPAQRLFQGVRKGDVSYLAFMSANYALRTNPEDGLVTLREMNISTLSSPEYAVLSLDEFCNVRLSSLSKQFRQDWRLVLMTVQAVGSETPRVLSIPSYPASQIGLRVMGLDGETAKTTKTQAIPRNAGFMVIREAIIYTAYFVLRVEEEAPVQATLRTKNFLSCLSLTQDNDVAFIFPYEAAASRRVLWANKAKLTETTSYFASMFHGEYQESTNLLTEVNKILEALEQDIVKITAAERARKAYAIHDDSDNDEAGLDQYESPVAAAGDGKGVITYVIVRETPYKTYRSLLQWLETRTITFATLNSATLEPSEPAMRASPKSVYRLCHQLGINDLKALAVADFEGQLGSSNVIQELFSSNCFHYEALKAAALRVLDKTWAEVKADGGFDVLLEMVNKGGCDTEEMMRVAIDIFRRV